MKIMLNLMLFIYIKINWKGAELKDDNYNKLYMFTRML